jgi:hypothetical protein
VELLLVSISSLLQGDIFAIRVQWKGADTSRHFFLTYSYADSCGTVAFQWSKLSLHLLTHLHFIGSMLAGEIRASGATASVSNYSKYLWI